MAVVIRSTAKMRRAFEQYAKTGIACRDALEYAIAKNYDQSTIDKMQGEIADKVRDARIRLELQANPTKYRQRLPGTFPSDPTPEWVEKAGKRLEKIKKNNGTIQFKQRSPLEQYRDKLLLSRGAAIERYQVDGKYAQRCRVANAEAARSYRGGDVIGGIGDIPNFARVGFARYRWINKYLGEEARTVAKALVTQEDLRLDGMPYNFEDFGQRLDPSMKHIHRRWGASFGALKVLAGQLVRLYELCPVQFTLVEQFERAFIECIEVQL